MHLKNLGMGTIIIPFFSSSFNSSSHTIKCSNPTKKCNCNLSNKSYPRTNKTDSNINMVNLNTKNLPGDQIIVAGKIYGGENNNTPLANVTLEIWHAYNRIHCDSNDENTKNNPLNEQNIIRGFIRTDAHGNYFFKSVRPGIYGKRARHFYYKITIDGYQSLVTQVFFKGDPQLLVDDLANPANDNQIINFIKNSAGIYTGVADIHL